MARTDYSSVEVVERGEALYKERVLPHIGQPEIGKYVVLNVETGDYAIGEDSLDLSRQLHARAPGAALYALRVGEAVTAYIGTGTALK